MNKILILPMLFLALFAKAQNGEKRSEDTFAISKTTVHIVSEYLPGQLIKYKFTVNGQKFILKNGRCMEYEATGDSVIIDINHKPIFKAQYPINLHTAAKEHLYVFIKWGHQVGKSILGHVAALEICESCYVLLLKGCRNK
jgi:hypothetical protein